MIVERLTTAEQIGNLENEWRALESQMVSLPFVTFDWALAWWNMHRAERLAVRDNLHFLAFRDAGGALCGVAPLMLTTYPGGGPLRISQLQFIGADPNLTELRCVAAPEALAETVYLALIDYLHRETPSCDWIKFTGIRTPAVAAGIVDAFGPPRSTLEVPNFILRLKPTWEEFRGGLPRNIRESLRKCYNAPKRDNVELELVKIAGGAELEPAVTELLRLHAARSTLADTVVHPNVFYRPESGRFLHEVCQRFAARDRLRIYQLRHQGTVVATRIGFVCTDSLYLYYSGYEPGYARYSVMTRVVAEAIQDAIAAGLTTVNLSIGRDVSKERWRPEEIGYREMEVLLPRRGSALRYRFFRAISGGLRRRWLTPRTA